MRMIERLDREMNEVHKSLTTQLIPIEQIQQQLDVLPSSRNKINP